MTLLKDDKSTDLLIERVSKKKCFKEQINETLSGVKDLKSPDGMSSTNTASSRVQESIETQRKKFTFNAKKSSKLFITHQKRSKMLTSKNGERQERYLVELQ